MGLFDGTRRRVSSNRAPMAADAKCSVGYSREIGRRRRRGVSSFFRFFFRFFHSGQSQRAPLITAAL